RKGRRMSNWEAAYIQRSDRDGHSVHVELRLVNEKGALVTDNLTPDQARALAKQLKKAAKQCESDEAKAWTAGPGFYAPLDWDSSHIGYHNPSLPERLEDL